MADEITTLGLGVDTSEVKSANKDLDQLTNSANQAGSAAEAMQQAMLGAAQATQAAVARLEAIVKESASATLSLAAAMSKASGANEDLAASTKKVGDAGDRLLDSLRDQVGTFGLSVDQLLRYRAAQAGVTDAADPLITKLTQQRAAQKAAADAAAAEADALRKVAQEKLAAERAQSGFLDSLRQQADTLGMSATEILRYRAAQLGVSGDADTYIKRIEAANDKTRTYGAGMKLTAHEAQQLSFQLNDLFVQIASGQSPIQAIIQQGSQLSGTFGGLGNTFAALSSVFTLSRIATAGVVGAIASVAAAAYQGSQQSNELRKMLVLTGNAAGLTEGKFNSLAESIATSTRTTISSSREILQGVAAGGQLSGDALEATSKAAASFAKVTGQSTEEVVKNFGSVADGASAWAERMNKSYNFLSAEQLKYIRQLEDQQRGDEAVILTMTAFNRRLLEAGENVSTLEKVWGAAKRELSGYVEELQKLGRTPSIDDQLTKAKETYDFWSGITGTSGGMTGFNPLNALFGGKTEQARAALQALQDQKKAAEDTAKAQADSAELERTRKTLNDQITASKGRQARYDKAIDDANKLLDKAQATPEQRKALLKSLEDQFDPGIAAARSASSVQSIQRTLSTLTSSYQDAESILDATRQAGLIADREYYDAKRAFINLNRDAQVKALNDENAALQLASRRENITTAERIGYQDKIKDNAAQIAQINAKAGAATVTLGMQQSSAAQAAARAYQEARQSAQDYLDTLTRSQNRELALMGAGNQARQREQGRSQIEDRYDQQRRALENNKQLLELEGKFNSDARKKYEDQLSLIGEFREKALTEWDKYYDARTAREQDWTVGASEALANYADNAANTAKQMEQVWGNAAKSMEDALVTFATTGKLNFKSLANSIIADLLRVEAQRVTSSIFSSVLGLAGSFFGGISVSPGNATSGITSDTILPNVLRGGRAIGGPVSAGGVYRINEESRPEVATVGGKDYLLTGGQGGTVRPAAEAGPAVNVNVNIGQGVTRNEVAALVPTIVKQVQAAVQRDQRRESTFGRG
ncbi:phage tail tape measure protein [Roseateles sp.]|uniref:phage tail tape measure protein n=1 Tax=Roseateles sp. TaxID=1971397 RepID=UPI0031D7417F